MSEKRTPPESIRKPPRMPVSDCARCGAKAGEYCKPDCNQRSGTAQLFRDLREEVKEAFSRWHRFEHNSVVAIEHDVMLALEKAEQVPTRRDMPCFCGTQDAYRCPAHINPVQFTSGGR